MMWNPTFKRLKPAYVEDCRNLIILFGQKNDFSYASFKSVWGDMKFTFIHDSKPEDVDDDDFMQELYRIFIDFLFIQGQPSYVRVGAIFGLYTLFLTRKGERVLIKIDDTVMQELQSLSRELIALNATDAFFALRDLRVMHKAFAYTAVMYTPGPPSTLPDEEISASVPAEWLTSNGVATSVDFLEIQRAKESYERAKIVALQEAKDNGVESSTIEELLHTDVLAPTVAEEIVKHESYMLQSMTHGITDPTALIAERMKLRLQAMSVGVKHTSRGKEEDEDEGMGIGLDAMGVGTAGAVPGDGEEDGMGEGGEGGEEGENGMPGMGMKRRRPMIGVQQQQQQQLSRPQFKRGRKSQYLQDFDLGGPMMTPQMMMQMDPQMMQQYQQLLLTQQAAMMAQQGQMQQMQQQQQHPMMVSGEGMQMMSQMNSDGETQVTSSEMDMNEQSQMKQE
ncbi:putative snRNA-activating protein complex subunit 1 [Monocercomonoides exilis]|uniref:putative snRNA-activating protein complex subunit 1 n=1 Tax=Monocercomonoides exilis TaxID=2049356 RepID=UPI0035593918|nr:putative snRNA-activating protein complex subunit 1 [Monocercomonoides exilis]|eukprot:MONOS_3867.1-p1 / transcript=MONOS_3867.1 / gene=MONOS_3867 / organism=Monocercomonoides_exilis_PA203 / gene_product=unspecified product / transcript_product=unspecified product / location=Mono_scaffold00095:52358-53868(-) / protein_length=449 / sequence_SO=supercontig / SO=protein_coding / is_pseudo=false